MYPALIVRTVYFIILFVCVGVQATCLVLQTAYFIVLNNLHCLLVVLIACFVV